MTAWARRRKQRFNRDTRLDWRDPSMPVFSWADRWSDGKRGNRLISAKNAELIAAYRLEHDVQLEWHQDPTYAIDIRARRV